jgi:hypothetical protein
MRVLRRVLLLAALAAAPVSPAMARDIVPPVIYSVTPLPAPVS